MLVLFIALVRWVHFRQDWFAYDMPSELGIWGLSTAFVNLTDLIPVYARTKAHNHSKRNQPTSWLLDDFLGRYSREWVQLALVLLGIFGFGMAMYWGGLAHAFHVVNHSAALPAFICLCLAYVAAGGALAVGILSMEARP